MKDLVKQTFRGWLILLCSLLAAAGAGSLGGGLRCLLGPTWGDLDGRAGESVRTNEISYQRAGEQKQRGTPIFVGLNSHFLTILFHKSTDQSNADYRLLGCAHGRIGADYLQRSQCADVRAVLEQLAERDGYLAVGVAQGHSILALIYHHDGIGIAQSFQKLALGHFLIFHHARIADVFTIGAIGSAFFDLPAQLASRVWFAFAQENAWADHSGHEPMVAQQNGMRNRSTAPSSPSTTPVQHGPKKKGETV